MPIFYVLVPDDLAERFDPFAAANGGRSPAIRKLITQAVGAPLPSGPTLLPPSRRRRLTVGIGDIDMEALRLAAAEMGLTPNVWVTALVRRRLMGQPTLMPSDRHEIAATQAHLRRISIGLANMARANQTELSIEALESLGAELRLHLKGLRQALAGNLDYWRVP